MARTVSVEAMRAMFAQETGDVPLICLTLEHESWTDGPIRVVYDTKALVRTVGIFHPAPFDISLPESTSERIPQVTLTIINMDANIVKQIKSIYGRIKVTMEVVMASHPDIVEAGPFEMYTLSADYDADKVSAALGHEEDILNTLIPCDKYLPSNSPGMFS